MNFGALKGLVENVVNTFKCPDCNGDVNDNNIDVIGAAGNNVNIDIECSNCGKHSMIKSEVLSIDLSNMNTYKEKIEKLKLQISNNKKIENKNLIKDEDIIFLNKDLKQERINVSDLFGNDNIN